MAHDVARKELKTLIIQRSGARGLLYETLAEINWRFSHLLLRLFPPFNPRLVLLDVQM